MNNDLDLSELTTEQIKALLWLLKGTPQAQPLYRELSLRTIKPSIALDDPEWDAKVDQILMSKLAFPR